MIVDNINSILNFIEFKNDDEFYFLQIIKRKKDCILMTRSESTVKNYYIKSKDHFLTKINEIKSICKATNARAYINLNVRSKKKVALKSLLMTAERISHEEYASLFSVYDSACGQVSPTRDKTWLIDVDNDCDNKSKEKITKFLWQINPDNKESGRGFKYLRVKTVNGYHLIVNPFNLKEHDLDGIDIHKNNPTVLYCDLNLIPREF